MRQATALTGAEKDGLSAAMGEDLYAEDEEAQHDLEAFERDYADERSWEAIQEDESGFLRPLDITAQQRERRRRQLAAPVARIRRGMIRYLYLVIDLSRAVTEMDFRPNRMAVIAAVVEVFVREFFDQNPLSHLGIIVLKNGVAEKLTELSGSPQAHTDALRKNLNSSGDASLQNGLELARSLLAPIPSYGHREVILIYAALNTCDPGDVMETVELCQKQRIRCSVIGLAAEVYICKQIANKTGGSYDISINEGHLKELLLDHAPPPPQLAQNAAASLVRMGFPQRQPEGVPSICACHHQLKMGGGFICPLCKSRVCELPTECTICGLTLVSSPHLARSYHHLFPIPPFKEWQEAPEMHQVKHPKYCFGCKRELPMAGGSQGGVRVMCPRCCRLFCFDCDIYIHESLHNCPGCECSVGQNRGS